MGDTNLNTVDLDTSLKMGGTEVLNTNLTSLPKVTKVALAIATTAAGMLNWVNPESGAIIVQTVAIDITTAASAALTIDVGVATSGTGISNDTIIDGASLAAAGVLDSIINKGTNGTAPIKVPAGQYVTGTAGTVATDSVVGNVYIQYIPV